MNRSFSRGLGKRLQPGKLHKIFYFIKYVNKKGFQTSKKVFKPMGLRLKNGFSHFRVRNQSCRGIKCDLLKPISRKM